MTQPTPIPTPESTAEIHKVADTDSSTTAAHHTLGIQPNQASPGSHNHDGRNSKIITAIADAVKKTGDTMAGILSLGNNALRLRGENDPNHYLQWNAATDGPDIAGYLGGRLGTTATDGVFKEIMRWVGGGIRPSDYRSAVSTNFDRRGYVVAELGEGNSNPIVSAFTPPRSYPLGISWIPHTGDNNGWPISYGHVVTKRGIDASNDVTQTIEDILGHNIYRRYANGNATSWSAWAPFVCRPRSAGIGAVGGTTTTGSIQVTFPGDATIYAIPLYTVG